MISFISFDGKKYYLPEDSINNIPECYIKGLATRFIKKDMDMDIIMMDNCIYLGDTSLYLDDIFNGLLYGEIEYKSNKHSEILNKILDRYCIELRAPIVNEPKKKQVVIDDKIIYQMKLHFCNTRNDVNVKHTLTDSFDKFVKTVIFVLDKIINP